ncbi:MAG: SUMF1/EgtB/PvdO family nonheme iron enzyme, partial [bacterium]
DEAGAKQNSAESDIGSKRVLRGGGWNSAVSDLRLSTRENREPEFMGNNIGFRCAQSIKEGE